MPDNRTSKKHALIDKANSTVTITVAVSAFIIAFSLSSSWSLLSQRNFQSRVITEKEKAVKQLEANKAAVATIQESYQSFTLQDPNVMGGSIQGQGEKDGDNAKIVLDALPSEYDYPAWVASIEKILKDANFPIVEISGDDNEVNQQENTDKPELVEIPFQFKTVGNASAAFDMLSLLERSIRPIVAESVVFQVTDEGLEIDYSGKTHYLPESALKIDTKVVR